jgi:thiol-disulfide isomerase/thioredoxin
MLRINLFLSAVFMSVICSGQQAQIIKLADLEEMMSAKSEKIQVINFWATWCGPCVKEIPMFESLTAAGRPDLTVTLVSLDLDLDPNPEKVYKFIARKAIKSQVLLLNEADPNSWINRIEKSWSGALPATLIINQKTGKRKFIGKELKEGELEKLLIEIQ